MLKNALVSCATLLPLVLTIDPAYALRARAVGEIGNPGRNSGVPNATYTLCAFSDQSKPDVPENNIRVFTDNSTDPPTTLQGANGVPNCGMDITIDGRTYSPPVGFVDRPKPNIPNTRDTITQVMSSTSGDYMGDAQQTIGRDEDNKLRVTLQAQGIKTPDSQAEGKAAGEAIDPYILPAGTYDYVSIINEIQLGTDEEDEFAGVTLFAEVNDEPLWNLSVITEGLINSVDDLQITFFVSDLLNLSSSEEQAILQNLISSFTVSNGSATLTTFPLFNTTLTLDETSTYLEGLKAGIEAPSIPEPSLVLGLVTTCGTLGVASVLKCKFNKN